MIDTHNRPQYRYMGGLSIYIFLVAGPVVEPVAVPFATALGAYSNLTEDY